MALQAQRKRAQFEQAQLPHLTRLQSARWADLTTHKTRKMWCRMLICGFQILR